MPSDPRECRQHALNCMLLAKEASSEERRKQLVQQVKQMGEQAKIGIRNIRRDEIKVLEKQEKDKAITEDDLETLLRG